MSTLTLTDKFIKEFEINKIIQNIPSGQKRVYIVEIKGVKYALKIIPGVDERINRELRIYQEFKNHKGIPRIIKTENFNGDLVIIEQFVEGNVLTSISSEYIKNSFKVRKLISDIISILTPIWEKKYVHRDIKPSNIIITPDDMPVVLDFGIARDLSDDSITPTGDQPYTPVFASPEQYRGKKDLITYRTDFFCLGLLAYYLYTGKYPFGNNKIEIAKCFMQEQKVFDIDDEPLNNFFNVNLRYNVYDRPRNIESLINSLKL